MKEKEVEYKLLHLCEEINKITYNTEIHNAKDILAYMKKCLENLNKDKLKSSGEKRFSNNEFNFIVNKITSSKSVMEFHKILNDELELKRDNGKTVWIKLIEPLKGDKNKNDIISINQVYVNCTKEHDNRFDVVILVNGIPLIQIENKKPE